MKSLSLYSSFFVLRGRIYEIKKILSLALSALLCVSVVGCSSQSKDDKVIKVGATLVPGGELLEELKNVKEDERKANFICVIVAVTDKGEKIVAEGKSYGVILEALSGNEGFGYDPLFFVPEYKKTFAEMTSDEKNAISHRGRALEKLKDNLKGILK